VDIVLPLLASGADRYVRLQRPTFERFYRDLRATWIYSRPDELEAVKRATAALEGVRVLSDLDLVPELKLARAVRGDVSSNWYQQQLIKLAAVARVETPFALVLDADVVAVRDVSDADMLPDGLAIHNREPVRSHPNWVAWAGAALGLKPLDYCASPTPAILARDAVLELAAFVERSVQPRTTVVGIASMTPGLRRHLTTWRGRLLGALPWTEYQLYDTFLVRSGKFDKYHCYRDDPRIWGNSMWTPGAWADWDPAVQQAPPTYFFSVIQEAARIPVDEIEARLLGAGILESIR
jgi:hypothetical protein